MKRFLIWPAMMVCLGQPLWGASDLPYQTDFPPAEFQARWNVVFDKIGDRAIAIVQGAPKANGFLLPRQTNEFYHLCGIETPHAYLILDGRDRRVTLMLPPRDARMESAEGKIISADDADLVKQLTGAQAVASTNLMTEEWMRQLIGDSTNAIFTPFAPAEGNAQSRGELRAANNAILHDPWDGRLARSSSRRAVEVSLSKSRNTRPDTDSGRTA